MQTQQQQRYTRKSADEKHILHLEAQVRRLEALLAPLDDSQKDELARYKRQVNQDFNRRWKLSEAAAAKRQITMTSRNYGLILAGFHPEASTEKRDAARNLFVKLCEKHVIHDKDKVK